MASRRLRTRRDKRAEAEQLLGLDDHQPPETADDAAFTLPNGERLDPRAPWAFPATPTKDERTPKL